jgi:phosphomannomutase
VCLRPSGTEPKLKAYVEVVEPVGPGDHGPARARQAAGVRAERLLGAVGRDLLELADPSSP